MMKNKKAALPHFFTLSNLFLGFLSIILASKDSFISSAVCIIFASICDDLDGRMARLTKSFSNFGKELDSLADAISFGAAPAFLVYKSNFSDIGPWGAIFTFLFLLAGIFRLARFNVTTRGFKKSTYKGLPIPMAAILISTFFLFSDHYFGTVKNPAVFLIMIPILSYFMISNIGFEPIPKIVLNRSLKTNFNALIYYIGFLLVLLYPRQLFFPFSVLYLLKALFAEIRKSDKQSDEVPEISIEDDRIIK